MVVLISPKFIYCILSLFAFRTWSCFYFYEFFFLF